jgi:hypothetical protein
VIDERRDHTSARILGVAQVELEEDRADVLLDRSHTEHETCGNRAFLLPDATPASTSSSLGVSRSSREWLALAWASIRMSSTVGSMIESSEATRSIAEISSSLVRIERLSR